MKCSLVLKFSFIHETMLTLYYHNPVLPPKTLPNPSPSFFATHKTLTIQSPSKKSTIKCAATTQNPQTKSKAHLQKLPRSAIQRIADKLRSLGIVEEASPDKTENPEPESLEKNSAGEIFIPLPNRIPKFRVGHTLDSSWSTPENPVPVPGSGEAIVRYNELRNEVMKQKRLDKKPKEKVVPSLAELKLSGEELRRLRTIGIGLRKKLKIGKAGITEGIVNGIHERWRNAEVVKIECEDLCRLNMNRTHDLLERKTGGLVVWRSGSKIILYRGANYKYPYFLSDKSSTDDSSPDAIPDQNVDSRVFDTMKNCSSGADGTSGAKPSGQSPTNKRIQPTLIHGVGSPDKVRFQLPGEEELAKEADRLLDGLGPRFTDWWGYDPQPVDADLLPAIVPGYRRPVRLLPYGVKPVLTNDEMNTLRRLGKPLPCHFALGRNRKLQGLAAAIIKLWEKCEIAKIAIKRGVQNTNSELMAEELKWLTGGSVLHRDKFFIVLYRGKDFLPAVVSSAIEERRKHGILYENQRTEFSTSTKAAPELKLGNIEVNCRDNVESDSENQFTDMDDQQNIPESEQTKGRSAEAAIRRTSLKLSMALERKAKAEKLLAELEKEEITQQPELDKEGITEEERYMLRKVGLRMQAFLLTGRRGVFAGTVENMHLHWKYRELVKIISKQKSIEAVHQEARTLEAESGGILVAVERVSKGHAIIIYRGKNYERPTSLRPKTLLTKRQALKRSVEGQRRKSLQLHVLELTRNINKLRNQLVKEKEANTMEPVDESRLLLVQEEMGNLQSAYVRSDFELKSSDNSQSAIPIPYDPNLEAREKHGADSTCIKSNDTKDATTVSLQATQQIDFSSTYNGIEMLKTDIESLSLSLSSVTLESGTADSDTCPDNSLEGMGYSAVVNAENCSSSLSGSQQEGMIHSVAVNAEDLSSVSSEFQQKGMGDAFANAEDLSSASSESQQEGIKKFSVVNAENFSSDSEPIGSSLKSAINRSELSFSAVFENGWKMASRVVNLSNRERLLLRKQALKMKKRPVLAIGKRNIVTGVAKTIKEHFRKHPLAIVNVKGRAKGTSVQEVVAKLQEATGAVLVSQEPSKVILYRGWGAEDEPGCRNKKNARDKTSFSREVDLQPAVSPELLAAIRVECGLQDQQEHEGTSEAGL
ncbi:CRM-domain containing factor CFM2, chloroplastic-like isoform X2 [Mangifera indica]|uniref:CRM-domain containing factor CFM2, chloroplastic-like isoform X2 n=1 Tax=Mangifera indica TaxID=29780 RepID=UPI001CFB1B4D|nr:CRM-domain containing factor CFM2, chloroplastic-like isoform X2 [Mangifera indica]